MNTREQAMSWWNSLSSDQKTEICDTTNELVGSTRRWETLTGREIELLFRIFGDSIFLESTFNIVLDKLLTTNKK